MKKPTAIDLYSGIGGWTLGLRNAGVNVLASFEWWKDANRTHNINFGTKHTEKNIRELRLRDLPKPGTIDFVVGSPPCTQFSFANRGGNGDLEDGLVDIKKFLEVVRYLKPKYWAMENVPRVAKILEKEISKGGSLFAFRKLFKDGTIKVYDSSDYGVPQSRQRMIAGKFPADLFESYQALIPKLTLGDVLNSLNKKTIVDPIYGVRLSLDELTDHEFEPNLSDEEKRLNEEAKTHHPVYNRMSFPDRWDRPARTITALCTRVSRESIVIKDHANNVRRLTVRERSCIQSFPINYQFYSNTYSGKLKMIGNAIPPLLSFYLVQSMLGIKKEKLLKPSQIQLPIQQERELPTSHKPENEGANYPAYRTFWLAIRGLRFGSGVRFELKNIHNKKDMITTWRVNLFYGNSKNIRQKQLDSTLLRRIISNTESFDIDNSPTLNDFISYINSIDVAGLQENWTNSNRKKVGPIELIDNISRFAEKMIYEIDQNVVNRSIAEQFIEQQFGQEITKIELKKFVEHGIRIYVGILIGCAFNATLTGELIDMRHMVAA